MLSHIIYSLSFKMIYIVYLGQKRGGPGPLAPPPLNPPLQSTILIKFKVSVEWRATFVELSSWLLEQEVRGSIPGFATWISEIGFSHLRQNFFLVFPVNFTMLSFPSCLYLPR